MILTWVMIYPSMCKNYDLFPIKIATQFALFSEKFTRLTRILHDRWSHRSRQISTLPSPYSRIVNRGKVHNKKSRKKLTSVSFAFTHTYTLEKLTLLLFFPKRTWKILKNAQNPPKKWGKGGWGCYNSP